MNHNTSFASPIPRLRRSEMQNRLFRRLGEWAMKPEDDLLLKRAAGPWARYRAFRPSVSARARQLFARAIETPRWPPDPDHPQLLRQPSAPFPAGGGGTAQLCRDGRPLCPADAGRDCRGNGRRPGSGRRPTVDRSAERRGFRRSWSKRSRATALPLPGDLGRAEIWSLFDLAGRS